MQFQDMKDVGGRPPKNYCKDLILSVMKEMMSADAARIHKRYDELYPDKSISRPTLLTYLRKLADEKKIVENIINDNSQKIKKKESKQFRRTSIFRYNLEG